MTPSFVPRLAGEAPADGHLAGRVAAVETGAGPPVSDASELVAAPGPVHT